MGCVIEAMLWQQEVILCTARFICLMAGRRAGKTDAIKARIKVRTQRPGFKYLYIAPLSFQSLIVFRELMSDLTWRPFIKSYTQRPYPQIMMHNGARIVFRSFQRPDGIKSTGEDEICLDESQDPKITEYDVDTVVMPMLGDYRGTLLMAGQFRGEDWRYTRFWLPGQAAVEGKPNPKHNPALNKSWRIPSSEGYVFKAPGGEEEMALLKSTVPPAVWDQEFACIPRSNANAVFPAREVDACVTASPRLPTIAGNVCSVDLGMRADPTAVVVMNAGGRVVHEELFKVGQEHAVSARQACMLALRHNAALVIEATGGGRPTSVDQDAFVRLYRQTASSMKIQFHPIYWGGSGNAKERIINQLALAIQQREVEIPISCTELIKQLKAYEYHCHPVTKRVQYGKPNIPDDLVAAFANAVEARANNWIGVRPSANVPDGAMVRG